MAQEPITELTNDLCGRYLQPLISEATPEEGGDVVFAMCMLFLKPSGKFLLCGTWPGFEYTRVAGQWTRSGQQVLLNGRGAAQTDVGILYEDDVFERVLDIVESDGVRSLKTDVELESWSLLSYAGSFAYIGHENVGVSKKLSFPETTEEIEQRIAEILSPDQHKS